MTKSTAVSKDKISVVRTGMTKLASGDERKCLTGTKRTMSMEEAMVAPAQSKVGSHD